MLEYEATYPLLRVYFNRREDFPKVWSVDDGDPANELIVSHVVTQGISRWVWSGDSEPNEDFPRAWVEFRSARIHKIDEHDRVFIENDSGW